MNITTKVNEITVYELSCFLSGALYDCSYWISDVDYDPEKYQQYRVEGDCYEDVLAKMLVAGEEIKLYDAEEDETHVLTYDKIKDGLGKMIDESEFPGWDDADGETYDMVMQYSLFGEVIYG